MHVCWCGWGVVGVIHCPLANTLSDMFMYLSVQGQGWLVRTRECLTDTLFNSSVYQQNESCDAISKFGFASHPGCYVNSGFCPIIGENLDNLYRLVTIIGVKDLLKPETLSAMQETLDLCEKMGYHIVVHDIWELIKKLIG